MADSYNEKSFDMSDYFEGKLDITMVKAHCVIITAQVDMNFIVVCERIMELQPSKKMNLIMMNESYKNFRFRRGLVPIVDAILEEFERSYHHLLHCFPDVRSLVEPVARIEEIQRV